MLTLMHLERVTKKKIGHVCSFSDLTTCWNENPLYPTYISHTTRWVHRRSESITWRSSKSTLDYFNTNTDNNSSLKKKHQKQMLTGRDDRTTCINQECPRQTRAFSTYSHPNFVPLDSYKFFEAFSLKVSNVSIFQVLQIGSAYQTESTVSWWNIIAPAWEGTLLAIPCPLPELVVP